VQINQSTRRALKVVATVAIAALAAALVWLDSNQGPRPLSGAVAPAETTEQAAVPRERLDPRLRHAWRFDRGRWVYVHLQGSPATIGFQHGYLLAPEIEDAFRVVKFMDVHGSHHDWNFFRQAAHNMLWPKIDREYQEELRGIVAGLRAHGVTNINLDDVVALNAFEELPYYYVPWYDQLHKVPEKPPIRPVGHCSAFVATGDWTRGHQIVMAHNAWVSYVFGERWRIVFDIVPTHGYHILMDGYPGVITSDDDFGINSAGLMVTETTITGFKGWNPNGIPEFERSRKALQYASSIGQYVRIMLKGNNGGYANDWLLGDRKTGQIARFELGLKYHRFWRSRNGYFVGSNFPSDPALTAQETNFNPNDPSLSENARHIRWKELMKQYKGRIDVRLAEQFLSDHYDTYLKKVSPDQRTLCGHVDLVPEGVPLWHWGPYHPGGAVQGKVTDSRMAAAMSFIARRGHPCGANFLVGPFLKAHPQFAWEAPLLHNMIAGPWTEFSAGQKR
jgi:hypothetical protein